MLDFRNYIILDYDLKRLSPELIFLTGQPVCEIVRKSMIKVSQGKSLKDLILQHRLTHIVKIIDVAGTNITLTKFVKKPFTLGLKFLDYETFVKLFPEHHEHSLL